MRKTLILFLLLPLLLIGPAWALQESVLLLRSMEDPSVPPAPEVCFNASFYDAAAPPNVRLYASLWATQTRSSDGVVVRDMVRRVGTAWACTKITSLAPGATAPFYMEIELADGRLAAEGSCLVASNSIPVGGIVLAGCTLSIPGDPLSGFLGGLATSNSVFNPFNLQGYGTGSFWTLHLYNQ